MSKDTIMETEPLLPQRTPEKERSTSWEGKDGALGWTVATAIMLINFITIGLGRMSGILYVDFMREYKVNRKLASAPFSVQQSTRNLFGPLVGVLGQRFGIRSVTIVGGLLGAGSAAACAFAKDITWITVFWGGLYGTGIAFTSTLSQVILDEYFENNLSSASGLSFSGGSVGAMVFSFVLQRTIDEFGLENSYFIMGAIILLVVPLAITLTSPPWKKKQNISNGSLNNKSNLALNKQLRKSLANDDMFSIQKETRVDRKYDKTQSLNQEESFKVIPQSHFEISSRFDKKDDSNLDHIYGTFKKDYTFLTGKDTNQSHSPLTISSNRHKLNGHVKIEKENIIKLMTSTQEFYPDSKARISITSLQDQIEDESHALNLDNGKSNAQKEYNSTAVSEKELCPNYHDVDHSGPTRGSSESNQKNLMNGLSCYKIGLEEKTKCNGINNHNSLHANGFNNSHDQKKKAVGTKEITLEYNSTKLDEVSELSRKLSPSNDNDYKSLYLRPTFHDDFHHLSFPKEDIIINFCETDSVNTLGSKINNDLDKLANGDAKSSNSDYKDGEDIYNDVDKVFKNGTNFHNPNKQSQVSKNLDLCAKDYLTSTANNSFNVDQGKNVMQDETINMDKPPGVRHDSNEISKEVTENKNHQSLEKSTIDVPHGMKSANSISKVDPLLYLSQNLDIEFLRNNTYNVIKILMLNANFFSEQLFRIQLEFLYSLAEKEKARISSEKNVFINNTNEVDLDQKDLKDQEGLDLDRKMVEDIFKTEQFNIFLDHLYCIFQKNESNSLLNFEEEHKMPRVIVELKKLYKFAYSYKLKHKRKEPESSSSSAEEMISTEKDTKRKSTRRKKKGPRRQKSTSLDCESPLQRQSSWTQQSLPSKLPSSEQRHYDDTPADGCCSIPRQIRTVLKLYLNPAFLVICLCRAVHLLTFMGVLTVIVDYSMDRGLKESDGKYAVTAMSLGDLIGRLCSGWVTDCKFVGLERFMLIAMLLIGIVSISFPLVPPSTVLLLACVYSILQGSVFIRHPILVSKYTRTEERTVGMGFMTLFSGLLGFLMPMYIGHFRDGIGSYNQVFYINGAICAGIGLLWIFEPWLKKFGR